MSKRKILTLAMALSMIAILAVGATLAYFTDAEKATNTFTIGDVDITLNETFTKDSKLIPGVDVTKAVNVSLVDGSENSFVRVHVAVPSRLDSGSEDEPQYAAYNNTLHWNMSKASMADGQWNWNKTNVNSEGEMAGYPGNGGAWNSYQQTIDGVLYNVYVATYETEMVAGDTTATNAIEKVYLDTKVTDEQLAEIQADLNPIKVLVIAEGTQAATFKDAYTALNTAFGVPGTYDAWNVDNAKK